MKTQEDLGRVTSLKDPGQLLDDADGHPVWLKEVVDAIFQRLPPPPPPAPPATAPLPFWDPVLLAKLQFRAEDIPLSTFNRWYIAEWLKDIAYQMLEGILEDSYLFTLRQSKPSSGPRAKRGKV